MWRTGKPSCCPSQTIYMAAEADKGPVVKNDNIEDLFGDDSDE